VGCRLREEQEVQLASDLGHPAQLAVADAEVEYGLEDLAPKVAAHLLVVGAVHDLHLGPEYLRVGRVARQLSLLLGSRHLGDLNVLHIALPQ